MRVLFVVSDANCKGGTEILAYNLLDRLNEIGTDCWLFSRRAYEGSHPRVVGMPQNEQMKYNRILIQPWNKLCGNSLSDKFLKEQIRQTARRLQVDWVVNHTYDLISAIPTDDTFQTAQVFNWSIRGYESFTLKFIKENAGSKRLLSTMSFKACNRRWHNSFPNFSKLVVLSEAARKEMREVNKDVNEDNIITIADPLMFMHDADNISHLHNKNLVYVGRLSYEKGVMRLLRIWEHIYKCCPDYTLSVYGEGGAKEDMVRYIREHKLQNVIFNGFSSDLEAIYTSADLCLMTSDTEGFGMVLIEAMYYGVPCISFDCPVSPKEIIADAGITVSCFDEEVYAKEVVDILKNLQKHQYLQQKAIERARDFYIDKIADKWNALLHSQASACNTAHRLTSQVVAFICYISGLIHLFYLLNRKAKRIVTFHNVVPAYLLPKGKRIGLTDTEEEFRSKVRMIKEHCGNNMLITFDDGYLNQSEVAGRILREEGNTPATIFAAGRMINNSDPEGALVVDLLLHWIQLAPNGIYLLRGEYAVQNEFELTNDNRNSLWSSVLWPSFGKDAESKGRLLLSELDSQYSISYILNQCNPEYLRLRMTGITTEEIKRLRSCGWQIGWHTNEHFPLSKLSYEDKYKEIVDAPDDMKKVVFSYPYGELESVDSECVKIAEEAGYPSAVSNINSNGLLLGRYFLPRFTLDGTYYQWHMELSGLKYYIINRRLLYKG